VDVDPGGRVDARAQVDELLRVRANLAADVQARDAVPRRDLGAGEGEDANGQRRERDLR